MAFVKTRGQSSKTKDLRPAADIVFEYSINLLDMALYSIDVLIAETRRLAAEFRRSTGTMLPVSGEIARYDVSRALDLTLTSEPCGYDAIGNKHLDGKRILIKSRVIGDSVKSGHRIGQLKPDNDWDLVILSLMDHDFSPLEMYMMTHDDVAQALSESGSKRGKRGAISVAKFKIIGDLVWTRELGIEPVRRYAS